MQAALRVRVGASHADLLHSLSGTGTGTGTGTDGITNATPPLAGIFSHRTREVKVAS
jgi:hypothetical protein